MIGRLEPGTTVAGAASELQGVSASLAAAFPDTNRGYVASVASLREDLIGDVRPGLYTLLIAVSGVLSIAFGNLAGMILARGVGRQGEIWTRAALGASRARLSRQLLVESLLLASVGGLLGLAIGALGSRFFVDAYPGELLSVDGITAGPAVIALGLGLALGVGMLFGLVPVAQLSAAAGGGGARVEAGRSLGAGTRRAQASVLVVQTALTLTLLVASGVALTSLSRLFSVDPGFRAEGLLTGRVMLPSEELPEPAMRSAFFDELLSRLEGVPGVEAVSAATHIPLSGGNMLFGTRVEGRGLSPEQRTFASYRSVAPAYFRTLGAPVLEGREFLATDRSGGLPVAVVNQAFVRQLLDGEPALGRRVRMSYGEREWREIVGVVGDLRHFGLGAETRPEVYVPFTQEPWPFMTLVLRTTLAPERLEAPLRAEVAAMAPRQPVDQVAPMSRLLSDSVAEPRYYSLLMLLFAAFATLAAAVGIYGLSSFWVRSGLTELGIRIALGASPSAARWLFLRRLSAFVASGLLIGSLLSMASRNWLFDRLRDSSDGVFLPLLAAAAALTLTVMTAGAWPAWRAGRIDPASVLRRE
ncbi:MAG: ABC transporter permease [Holophagales bacterium]|nr:ABC transporter permease [Holophagales bacterium]